jgi:hypothetical protein
VVLRLGGRGAKDGPQLVTVQQNDGLPACSELRRQGVGERHFTRPLETSNPDDSPAPERR